MADSYLSIAAIANDQPMNMRMNAAVTQQLHLGSIVLDPKWGDEASAPVSWVANYRYVWAAEPGWGAAWDSALAGHPDDPDYKPGEDPGVITDGMILAAVQALCGPDAEPKAADAAD